MLKEIIIDKNLYTKFFECKNCKNNCIFDGFEQPFKSYQCSKGHCFCKDCWLERDENTNKCLNNNCTLNEVFFDSLTDNGFASDLYAETMVSCPNRINKVEIDDANKGEGCNEIISIRDYKEHRSKCEFEMVSCTHKECIGQYIMRKNLDYHNANFNNELIKCFLCKSEMKRSERALHLSEICGEVSHICQHCSKPFVRKEEAKHLLECQELIINCEICSAEIKRKDMVTHYNHFSNHSNQIIDLLLNNINNSNINDNKNHQLETIKNQLQQIENRNNEDQFIINDLKEKNNQFENKIADLEKENYNLQIKNEEILNKLSNLEKLFNVNGVLVNNGSDNGNNGNGNYSEIGNELVLTSLLEKNHEVQNLIIKIEKEKKEMVNKLYRMEEMFNKFKQSFKNIKRLVAKCKGTWLIEKVGEKSMVYGFGNLIFRFKLADKNNSFEFYILTIEFDKYFDSPVLIDYELSIEQKYSKERVSIKSEFVLDKNKSIDIPIQKELLYQINGFNSIYFTIKQIDCSSV